MPLLRALRLPVSSDRSHDDTAGPPRSPHSAEPIVDVAAAMLAMQQQPLEPGLRRVKKGNGKEKLKNRVRSHVLLKLCTDKQADEAAQVSMAFKKPFLSKPKSPEPVTAPAPRPPAYSLAAPATYATLSRSAPAPIDDERRHSGGAGRSNKPTQQASEGVVARRPHTGAGVIGSSPPLPPLPRKDSVEPVDPRVIALLGGDLSSQVDPLLPRNSFGPSFGASMDGLGIGVEQAGSFPPSPARTPQRVPTPPHVEIRPLNVRRRSTSPPPQPPSQLLPCSPPQRPQGPPPALARPVTAPEGMHILRRKSMLRADSEPSEASRRLSLMRRGPPVFASDALSTAGSTTSDEPVSLLLTKMHAPVTRRDPESVPLPGPAVAETKADDPDAFYTSRDRISLLRGGRASLSAASGYSANGLAAKTGVVRGGNRKDATKSYTIGAAPAGFDVSLVTPQRPTFTPLRPLHLSVTHGARSAHVSRSASATSMKAQPIPPPLPPPRSSERYCLRPTVNASTQTPREWREPAVPAHAQAAATQRRTWAASTPPQAYGAFPTPLAVPPPVPPHDTPPQRLNISPSIYSVASFDPRTGKSAGGHRQNRSLYLGDDEFDEQAELAYGAENESPRAFEGVAAVRRYSQLPNVSETPETARIPTAINYDVPYLSPFPYDDAGSTHRAFDMLATPLPPVAPQHNQVAPPQAQPERNSAVSPAMSAAEDCTPSITPVQRATSTFEATLSRAYSAASLGSPARRTPTRPRTASPVPALSNGDSSAEDDEEVDVATSSQTSSVRRASSTRSSARRSSASEPLTPPTSAVSSIFPGNVSGSDAALSGDEGDAVAVVTIRKASLVTNQVHRASLVASPPSRPTSAASAHLRASSIGSASSSGSDRAPSPRSLAGAAGFHSDLARQDEEDEISPVPAPPGLIPRESVDEAFRFPASASDAVAPAPTPAPVALLASPQPVAPSPRLDSPIEQLATPALSSPRPALAPPARALERARPASAPPEESASLPLRRQSESDTAALGLRAGGSARAGAARGGLSMSREERAARGRSYFLVQALMGESQPEGMIRDWARGEGDGSDDDVSILGGESSVESEFSTDEDDE
ncbi:hypothetical protein JCM3770_005156 [Rhodotorula araucariae]